MAQMAKMVENELKTNYAYMAYANSLRDHSQPAIAEEFLEHAGTETDHAEWLMRRLSVLGGALQLPDIPAPPPSTEPAEIIRTMIRMEQEGINNWNILRKLVGDDNPMRFKVEEYMTAEQEHLDDLRQMLPKESTPLVQAAQVAQTPAPMPGGDVQVAAEKMAWLCDEGTGRILGIAKHAERGAPGRPSAAMDYEIDSALAAGMSPAELESKLVDWHRKSQNAFTGAAGGAGAALGMPLGALLAHATGKNMHLGGLVGGAGGALVGAGAHRLLREEPSPERAKGWLQHKANDSRTMSQLSPAQAVALYRHAEPDLSPDVAAHNAFILANDEKDSQLVNTLGTRLSAHPDAHAIVTKALANGGSINLLDYATPEERQAHAHLSGLSVHLPSRTGMTSYTPGWTPSGDWAPAGAAPKVAHAVRPVWVKVADAGPDKPNVFRRAGQHLATRPTLAATLAGSIAGAASGGQLGAMHGARVKNAPFWTLVGTAAGAVIGGAASAAGAEVNQGMMDVPGSHTRARMNSTFPSAVGETHGVARNLVEAFAHAKRAMIGDPQAWLERERLAQHAQDKAELEQLRPVVMEQKQQIDQAGQAQQQAAQQAGELQQQLQQTQQQLGEAQTQMQTQMQTSLVQQEQAMQALTAAQQTALQARTEAMNLQDLAFQARAGLLDQKQQLQQLVQADPTPDFEARLQNRGAMPPPPPAVDEMGNPLPVDPNAPPPDPNAAPPEGAAPPEAPPAEGAPAPPEAPPPEPPKLGSMRDIFAKARDTARPAAERISGFMGGAASPFVDAARRGAEQFVAPVSRLMDKTKLPGAAGAAWSALHQVDLVQSTPLPHVISGLAHGGDTALALRDLPARKEELANKIRDLEEKSKQAPDSFARALDLAQAKNQMNNYDLLEKHPGKTVAYQAAQGALSPSGLLAKIPGFVQRGVPLAASAGARGMQSGLHRTQAFKDLHRQAGNP
jgi:bacterioferritin (cytochrome b1)/TolA-binding protein